MEASKLDRRGFLKSAALGTAAMAVAGAATAFAEEAPAEDADDDAVDTEDDSSIPAPIMAEAKYASKDPEYTSDGVKVGTWRTKPDPITDATVAGEADVIVVGHGYAGITACREIAEQGHSVILVEKQYEDMFMVIGNENASVNGSYMLEVGLPEIDPLEYYNNWMLMAGYTPNPDLIMKFAQNSGTATDWYLDSVTHEELEKGVSVKFHGTGTFEPALVDQGAYDHIIYELGGFKFYPTAYGFYGATTQTEIHTRNRQKAIDAGAQFFFNRQAEQLVQDEDGRVTGVIAKNLDTDEYEQFNGRAVVMATGDFGANEDMVKDLLPDVEQILTDDESISLCVIAGRDGAGVRLPYWAGAKLEPQIATMGMRGGTPAEQPQGIWLNSEGKRVCNEFHPVREFAGNPLTYLPREPYYCIYDANFSEYSQYIIPGHSSTNPCQAYMDCLAEVLENAPDAEGEYSASNPSYQVSVSMYGANTIEELFAKAGVTDQTVIDNAKASIERYNEFCAAGRDDDYARDPSVLFPVEKAPYYMSVRSTARGSALVTMGGIVTDGDQRALDNNYKPIPGLYVSGNCCGRRFGQDYVTPTSGVSLGIAICLGRECGKSVCADLDEGRI
jgi:succinate dehydrogenase/fumarate reductase flavoprotein subunit